MENRKRIISRCGRRTCSAAQINKSLEGLWACQFQQPLEKIKIKFSIHQIVTSQRDADLVFIRSMCQCGIPSHQSPRAIGGGRIELRKGVEGRPFAARRSRKGQRRQGQMRKREHGDHSRRRGAGRVVDAQMKQDNTNRFHSIMQVWGVDLSPQSSETCKC